MPFFGEPPHSIGNFHLFQDWDGYEKNDDAVAEVVADFFQCSLTYAAIPLTVPDLSALKCITKRWDSTTKNGRYTNCRASAARTSFGSYADRQHRFPDGHTFTLAVRLSDQR